MIRAKTLMQKKIYILQRGDKESWNHTRVFLCAKPISYTPKNVILQRSLMLWFWATCGQRCTQRVNESKLLMIIEIKQNFSTLFVLKLITNHSNNFFTYTGNLGYSLRNGKILHIHIMHFLEFFIKVQKSACGSYPNT